jgi:[ribosomal protein S5]-alanine N-acetyltransferase
VSGRIGTERLDLVLLTPVLGDLVEGRRERAAEAIEAGMPSWWPDPHDAGFLHFRRDQAARDPTAGEWLVRAVVLREAGEMIGHAGFHGPPGVNALKDRGAVEVGYTVFPEHRGRGYASEAVRGLMRWASEEHGVRTFVASVGPENGPSLAIVRKLGFVHVGEHWDEEDGRELEFRLDLSERALPSPHG